MRPSSKFNNTPRSILFFIMIGVLLIILQDAILGSLWGGSFVPQLLAILVVFLAFYWRSFGGLFVSWLIGLVADFHLAILIGPAMIATVLLYLVFSFVANNFYTNSKIVLILSGFVGGVVFILGQQIVQSLFIAATNIDLWSVIGDALATAVFVPIVLPFLRYYFLINQKI